MSRKPRAALVERFRRLQLDSTAALRQAAAAWDDLWQRSAVTLPSAQAVPVAEWLDFFAPANAFRAVLAADGDRLVAALPLRGRRLGRWLNVGAIAANEWLGAGDLLVDPAVADTACDLLVAEMKRLPWPLLWLDDVAFDAPAWQSLRAALRRAGVACEVREHLQVGRLDIDHDWAAYRAGWSRKHRQHMAACVRRLEALGPLRLSLRTTFSPGEVEADVRTAMEIENRGWKGPAGTSVLGTPGMFGFFLAEARQLARSGHLELAFLELAGRPIAFAFGQTAKGVFHSCKIGYEPELADYSPGQVLRLLLLERCYGDPSRQAVDFQGPLTPAHAAWRPAVYPVGRVAIALGVVGRVLLSAYRRLRRRRGARREQLASSGR